MVLLFGKVRVFIVERHRDGKFIVGLVVQINEAVIHEESGVALLAITIENLFSLRDVSTSLQVEAISFFAKRPDRHFLVVVVDHVGKWDETAILLSIDFKLKYSA